MRFHDACTDPDILPDVNNAKMAGTMKVIKEYLHSCHGIMRAPFAYVIRKTTIVQTCGDYPKCVSPDDEIFARMLHLPPENNKLYGEKIAQSVKEAYSRVQNNIYNILD